MINYLSITTNDTYDYWAIFQRDDIKYNLINVICKLESYITLRKIKITEYKYSKNDMEDFFEKFKRS